MDKPQRLIVHAPNVRSGGGVKLLRAVLDAADAAGNSIALVAADFDIAAFEDSNIEFYRFSATPAGRWRAEVSLRHLARPGDTILAFGNMPPLSRLEGRVVLYLHNRLLIDRQVPLAGFRVQARFRIAIERLWLSMFIRNVDRILLQSPAMAERAKSVLGRSSEIVPFDAASTAFQRRGRGSRTSGDDYDFLYVASGDPHKNHERLLDAWSALADEGIRPSLCLTLPVGGALTERVEQLKRDKQVAIENAGLLTRPELDALYKKSKALIFPSLMESFGLPLIEAREAGLAIVASELDYVRDVIDPEECFDPYSARSIARAVKRFLAIPEPALPIVSAKEFILRVLDDGL